jgi:hypothetical protein
MRVRLFLIALLAVLSVSQTWAQSDQPAFARGIYFAGMGRSSTVGGGFDGQSFYNVDSGAEVIVVPKLNPGFGAGGLLGYRAANWAYEAGGCYSAASSSFGGSPFDTSTLGFTFDIQWLPFTGSNFQPYLTAGLGISTLTVRNGSSDAFQVGDAMFYLGGFRAGLGIEVWMNRQFFLRFQGIYRIDRVVSIQGVNDSDRIDLNDPLNADGYEVSLIIGAVVF